MFKKSERKQLLFFSFLMKLQNRNETKKDERKRRRRRRMFFFFLKYRVSQQNNKQKKKNKRIEKYKRKALFSLRRREEYVSNVMFNCLATDTDSNGLYFSSIEINKVNLEPIFVLIRIVFANARVLFRYSYLFIWPCGYNCVYWL